MSITIEFATPEEEAAFKAKAAAEGLSVDRWVKKLARERASIAGSEANARARNAVAQIREIRRRVEPLGIPIREAIEDGRLPTDL